MKIFETVSNTFSKAVSYVSDKNHKAALINRLRIVIKNERENASHAYIALGKYYCEHLRDPKNELTERLCRSAEDSEARIRKAIARLDALTSTDIPAEEPEEEITPSDFFTGRKLAKTLPNWTAED